MKSSLSLILVISLIIGNGCCSSGKNCSAASHKSDATVALPIQKKSFPASLKQNATKITAVVDILFLKDESDYLLSVEVRSSKSIENFENIFEGDSELILEPNYVLTENGEIDTTNEINKKLLDVRTRKPQDQLIGIISKKENGRWLLVDVSDN